jgi:ATP-dependent protease ClpP protease subunit
VLKSKIVTVVQEYSNICIASDINDGGFYERFIRNFTEMMSVTKEGDRVTMFFNSRGGCTRTSLGIHDLLQGCGRNTVGIVAGIAHSGASLILQACKTRLMTVNSSLMLHGSTVGWRGAIEDAQAALDQFRSDDKRFLEIYSLRSGLPEPELTSMTRQDKYLGSREALAAHLIDDILP